jgi:hypothetical protein
VNSGTVGKVAASNIYFPNVFGSPQWSVPNQLKSNKTPTPELKRALQLQFIPSSEQNSRNNKDPIEQTR